ncbi:hypothetical protein RRG08_036030 [Elysia crispata]|uniref:Uncharacterized protein n=1 Tax=Elysia crispata TaxID=231223 RepID=A0AAE1E0P8_9GAST|nr:hypothetical protein RRG08_036030 [Elysia crispata]
MPLRVLLFTRLVSTPTLADHGRSCPLYWSALLISGPRALLSTILVGAANLTATGAPVHYIGPRALLSTILVGAANLRATGTPVHYIGRRCYSQGHERSCPLDWSALLISGPRALLSTILGHGRSCPLYWSALLISETRVLLSTRLVGVANLMATGTLVLYIGRRCYSQGHERSCPLDWSALLISGP